MCVLVRWNALVQVECCHYCPKDTSNIPKLFFFLQLNIKEEKKEAKGLVRASPHVCVNLCSCQNNFRGPPSDPVLFLQCNSLSPAGGSKHQTTRIIALQMKLQFGLHCFLFLLFVIFIFCKFSFIKDYILADNVPTLVRL